MQKELIFSWRLDAGLGQEKYQIFLWTAAGVRGAPPTPVCRRGQLSPLGDVDAGQDAVGARGYGACLQQPNDCAVGDVAEAPRRALEADRHRDRLSPHLPVRQEP